MPNAFDQFDAPPAKGNAFDQFDAAPTAAPPKSLLHHILDYALNNNPAAGAAEDVTQAATGALARIPAGIAGLVRGGANALGAGDGTPAADTVAHIEHALTYQPVTNAGQVGDELVNQTARLVTDNPVTRAVDPVLGKLADATGQGPLIRSAVPAIADAAANVLPLAKGLIGARAAAAEPTPAVGAPSDAAPLATARGLGFKTSASNVTLTNPTRKPGIANQFGEVLSGGNSAITRANNIDNTALATQHAADQLGLGSNVTKINIPDLAKAKVAPAADYDATAAKVGDFAPSPNLTNLLSDAQADMSPQAAPASRTAAKNVLQSIAANGGKYSGADAVGDISKLRESPSTRPIANMLEDEMGRQLEAQGDGAALTKYQNARRQFAQIFAVQDALKGGQVDPQALLAADPKLQFLTGKLRGIASAANELPNDVRLPDATPEGTLDAILGKTKGVAGSIVRPFMRSNLVQNQFGPEANAGGQSYQKTFGLPPGADEPPAPSPLKLALAPGNAGRVMPSQGGPHSGTQGELPVPQNPRPLIDLAPAEGTVGRPTPVQGALSVPEGPESISGAPPASRAANDLVRPLGEAFQPHQKELFPPQNVRNVKTVKPKGVSDEDWDKLVALGFGE